MNLRNMLVGALAISSLVACDNDGDILYTPGGDTVSLDGTQADIVLDKNNLEALALTIYWTDNGEISLSDPRVEAPKYAITNTVQMSPAADFATVVETTMNKGEYQLQFTAGQLNNLLGRLGFEGGVTSPLYIRIKSVIGNNMEPTYSNMLSVNVTPYKIDMSKGFFLDVNKGETSKLLYSATSNGIYEGFIGAGAWENWYLQEGNGVLWGNENVSWQAFKLGSADQAGNMWYPGISGCYYTIVNTVEAWWSAELVKNLTLSGDLEGEMEFNRKENIWTYTFNATPGTLNISISGTSALYNVSTGTDDNAAIASTVAFGGKAGNLERANSATPITVESTASGEATLTLDFSDPSAWTLSITAGSGPAPIVVNPYLYITGIDDGISGSWTYDNYLTLYNEDSKLYGGACNVNSLWGYLFMNQDSWGDGYGFDSGDAMSGTLNTETSSNIPAPAPGQYVMDVSLTDMTYKLFAIESVGYAGLNDDWTIIRPMEYVGGCTYQAVVEKSANTPWGVKILINNGWDIFFGGGSGNLRLYQDGFDGDNDLENGNYLLTVDLNKGTYSYEKQ